MDLGRDPTEGFFRVDCSHTVNISGALSDPVPIYTVFEHWPLATPTMHGCVIHVGVSFESPSM